MNISLPSLLLCALFLHSIAGDAADVRQIAITVDDVDMNSEDRSKLTLDERNSAILDALRAQHIKAAMFVTGKRVDSEQGKRHLAQIDGEGHLIGNHSYSHFAYPETDFGTFSADVLRGEDVVNDYAHFQKIFRFPYLKEGDTAAQRDSMRTFLLKNGYSMGYVTVDTSDWAIDMRLRKMLGANAAADLAPYRTYYVEHILDRASFYDELARDALKRPIKHTLLIHHNLLNALFLSDVLTALKAHGWELIDASVAFGDPIFRVQPDTAPAGQSIVWAIAKQSGKFDQRLRYPGEDDIYEKPKMDERGL